MTSINILDLVLRDIVSRVKHRAGAFQFLQIGAHDGKSHDCLRPYVDANLSWKGVLVEPQPKVFERLKESYHDNLEYDFQDLKFENAAISSTSGTIKLYGFNDPNLPDHATMLATVNPHAIQHNGHGYVGNIEEMEVPAMILSQLFEKHQITSLDFLQIDTEGHDYEILKMLPATGVKPTAIHFESAMLSIEDREACNAMLSDMGYALAFCGIDTVAYLQQDLPPK